MCVCVCVCVHGLILSTLLGKIDQTIYAQGALAKLSSKIN